MEWTKEIWRDLAASHFVRKSQHNNISLIKVTEQLNSATIKVINA